MTLKTSDNCVIIKITNNQIIDDDAQKTELTTEGQFYESKGKYYIFYNEEDTDKSKVMIVVDNEEVTISKKGNYSTKMIYYPGYTSNVNYLTPYGNMEFTLKTIDVINNLSVNGGELILKYDLNLQDDVFSNHLTLVVQRR